MIFSIIKRMRERSVLSLVFLLAGFLTADAALFILSFVFVYSLVFSALISFFVLIVSLILVFRSVGAWMNERRDLLKNMELALYGERKLLLDSLVEFDKKKTHPELVKEGVEAVQKSDKVRLMERKMARAFFLKLSVALAVIALSFSVILVLYPRVSGKAVEIAGFTSYRLKSFLPEHYIDSKPLRIDLAKDAPFFDRLTVTANSNRLESVDGVFIIDPALTVLKQIVLNVEGTKFGLSLPFARKKLNATTQLLIEHIVMNVRYPSSSGLPPEEFTGLQDLEVWQGAAVELNGDVTKKLTGLKLVPGAKERVNLENERFRIYYVPDRSQRRSLELVSDDNDRAVSSEFLVKVNGNERPGLRLLFPTADIRIGQYQWSVLSLLEGDDDQGIRSILAEALVTNRDPLLKRYAYKKKWTVPCSREKNIRKTVLITYKDLDLLPDEVASVSFRAEDVFGKQSLPAGFNIIVPDLLDIQRENSKSVQRINSSMKDVSNSYEKMQEELRDRDLSGAQQQMRRMESGVSNISDALGELDRTQTPGMDEIRESIQRMKEVTESLKQNAEIMKQLLSLMQTGKEQVQEIRPGERKTADLLKELSSMLKNLEYYKKFSDMLTQFQITKNVYEKLKNSGNEKDFKKNLDAFRNELEKLGEAGKDKLKDRTDNLTEETKRYDPSRPGDKDQFKRSDDLMKELEKDIRDLVNQASTDRVQSKIDQLERVIEELFLYAIFIEDTLKLDLGTTAEPNVTNTAKATETANSIQYSFKMMKPEIENALSGVQFGGNTLQDLGNTIEDMDRRISFLQETLKEHMTDTLRPAFYYLEKSSAYLFVYLVRISGALREAAKEQKPGQNNNQMASLSMQELMKMQNGMSTSMQDLMQRLQKEGKLTPQMKEEMERLASLQEEIRNTLAQMIRQNQSGVFEGGNEMNKTMDDIIRDLQSYNVKKETLEKSRQLEEKLLKSKKSIESRGISDERKAETAKTYEVKPPDRNDTGSIEKLDLDSIKDKKVSEYYKKLIERYKKR